MMNKFSPKRAIGLCGAGISALALLAACGGGGGSGAISTPAPAPAPTPSPSPSPSPSPTPTPTPTSSFNTAEFRRSDGPDFHNAVTAWQDGATGQGQTIAVIDSGLDSDNPEFSGRIHPDSQDVVGNRGFDGVDDHGTHVALVAAAARNGTGMLGIAFDSTVLALRADASGSCSGAGTPDATNDCSFFDSDIAAGIDQAIASGATVINISLGGGTPLSVLTSAVQRAAAADIVVVVSAGNDGDGGNPDIPPDQPDPFASGLAQAGNGNVIIVGSVDENGVISDFSNKAGSFASTYIAARGEGICCIYEDGQLLIETDASGNQFVTIFSGTSFSAPQVSGAVALLAQAFPNLTAVEIVSILLESASDAGVAGPDAIYGSGILDIAQAFQPRGITTLAGSSEAIPLGDDTAVGSPAMGDALSQGALSAVILDKYRRAYSYGIGARFRGAQQSRKLYAAVGNNSRRLAGGNDKLAMSFTVDASGAAGGYGWSRQLRLTSEEAQAAEVLAGRVAMRLSPKTRLAVGLAESAGGLGAQLRGSDRPAFLLAEDSSRDSGFRRGGDLALAVRHTAGPWGLTLTAEQGEAWLGNWRRGDDTRRRNAERYDMRSIGLMADRKVGPASASLGLTWLAEDRTVLGGYFHDAFGTSGADTLFIDTSASLPVAPRWRIGADIRNGFTRARRGGMIAAGSDLRSMGWSFDIARSGVMQKEDSLGLRIAQPLRVEGGGVNFELPVAYDYATETAHYGLRSLSLSPDGRELMGEIAWRGTLWAGGAAASLYYRHEPGHYAQSRGDAGVALKWSKDF